MSALAIVLLVVGAFAAAELGFTVTDAVTRALWGRK